MSQNIRNEFKNKLKVHKFVLSFEFKETIVKEGCVTIGRVHI